MKLKFESNGCVPKIELSTDKINFERQICGSDTLQQKITLKNTSLVGVKWNLSKLEDMPHEFKFSKTNGNIPPNKKDHIEISFTPSHVEKQLTHLIDINVLDTRKIQQDKDANDEYFSNNPVVIMGESFKMLPDIDIPDSHLDFGVVKVNSKSIQKFTINNNGKYSLKFKLISSGKAAIRKLVKTSMV